MSVKTGLLIICAAVFVLITGSLYVVSQAVKTEADIAAAEARRYQSYKLADELRQSSDDLTRMARLYAVTGEARYQVYFDRILAIRDGKAPRPLDYGNVYWDFVMAWGKPPRRDGAAVSLEQLMREARFTDDELALLQQAKHRSDALVSLEAQAIHAVQGRFLDVRGQFSVVGRRDIDLARRLLHGPEYERAKAEIMAPIHDFFIRVESRTAADVQQLRRRGERLHVVVIAGLGTAVILVLISFALVARYSFVAVPRETAPTPGGAALTERPGLTLELAIWTIWPILTAAAVACVLVLGLSWWLSKSTDDKVRSSIRSALEAVHQSTARSVEDWLTSIDQEASAWARSPVVRGLLARSPTSGGGPRTRNETRELLAPLRGLTGVAGYFVVDSKGHVLASDDAGLLSRPPARQFGEALVSEVSRRPDYSMVVLPSATPPGSPEQAEFPRDILVAVGVLDDQGVVGAALALRLDPRLELSRILQRGRVGESGETYAFTRSASMISESRFRDQLRGIEGLRSAPDQASSLAIDLRDPGVDLTAGGRAAVPRPQQPLTRMARAALAGHSGVDLDGYRDYRGVPVIGAWTWNERYGIGSATEVGLAEAYGALGDYQRHTRLATGLSLVLIAGLSGVFAWNRMAMAVAAAKLEAAYEVIRGHKDRMEAELQVGHDLQLSMVPRQFPAFPARDGVSVYATLQPARELGGDFYDYYFVDDTHLFFCVGDVSDKGVPAALFMAVAKTLIRARSAQEPSTAKIADYLNAELSRDNEKCMFVTLFMGRLDVTTGELLYTNAGHDPPYLHHADGSLQPLAERHGPLVGVAANVVYRESRCHLGPGDLLVVYTDGVTEAQDARGRFFSEERLAELMRADGALSTNGVVDRILAAVESFEGGAERADDITVLALQVLDPADREPMIAETVVLRNQLSDLETLDPILDRFGRHGRLPAATMAELRVVCDDIVSNVINHGYPHGGEHDIEVRLELTGRRLVVTVSDDGVAFNPLAVPPPDTTLPLEQRELGGLGIHLVRNLTDEATYGRHGGRNVITLVKIVPGPSPDPPAGSPREPLLPL
jgi:sigma-B regulation protein RsbU (phosphoserine phosphatase)